MLQKYDPRNRDLLVKNTNPDHPVMKGFHAEWLDKADELYKNEELYENFVPLAKAYGEDTKKDHHVIWVNTVGKGKVFGTTLGHFHDNFGIEAFRRMLVNGILWAAHIEVPVHGAPVAVDDSDLILPPPPVK